jgi:WD40 repeat protein
VRIWDVATGRERAILKGHTGNVRAVAVAPDGSWLASGSWDKTVRIWDVATGREHAILKGHTSYVYAVAVAPDGSWLASASSDNTVRIWDVATGQPRALMRLDSNLFACAWLGNGGLTVSGSAGLYLFDLMADHIATAVDEQWTSESL